MCITATERNVNYINQYIFILYFVSQVYDRECLKHQETLNRNITMFAKIPPSCSNIVTPAPKGLITECHWHSNRTT